MNARTIRAKPYDGTWHNRESAWFAEPLNHQLKPGGTNYYSRWFWVRQHVVPGSFVLDIGCNCGQLAMNLSAELECHGVGVDVVPDFIAYCRQQAIPGWSFVCADLTRVDMLSLGMQGQAFNVVTALEVIEHPIDVRGFRAMVLEAIVPEGQLLVTTPHPQNPVFGYGGRFFSLPWHVRMWTPWRLQQVFGEPDILDVIPEPDGSPGHLAGVWTVP